MNTCKYGRPQLGIVNRVVALLSVLGLLAGPAALGLTGQQKALPNTRLTEAQQTRHILNRLGFGARPGDVERVEAIGVESYINEQLNPEKIADPVAQAKVKDLPTLSMAVAELYEKYPQPGQLVRQLQRRGELPADLAVAQNKGAAASPGLPNPPLNNSGEAITAEAITKSDRAKPGNEDPAKNPNNEEYRKAVREYYLKNGLQLPQRISGELQASRILRAVYSERQLQEVMVDFWSNHFNVFAGKGADRWLLTSYDRDTIRPNTLGKFYALLLATAESPAMLFYLDNVQSVSPKAQPGNGFGSGQLQRRSIVNMSLEMRRRDALVNPSARQQAGGPPMQRPQAQAAKQQKRGINENYARELMELHTLGVDGGYTQKDVQEVARCFTGWTIFAPRGAAPFMGEAGREKAGKFYFNSRLHDDGEKTVLGHKIPAGGAMKDGLMVLDILAHYPSTAKFIATKLVRHFVMDDPPAALVSRVAAAFTRSDGDIRETLRTIFFSPEFNSPEAYQAKVKRPFELAVSAIRTLGADTNGGPQLQQWIARMGEPLYGFQTPNGYSDVAENWVNTGALLERLNFGLALASNRILGTHADLARFAGDTAREQSVDKTKLMDRFLSLIVQGEISPQTKATLVKLLNEQAMVSRPAAANSTPAPERAAMNDLEMDGPRRPRQLTRVEVANITDPVTKIVGLILGSPEFQRQ